MSIAATGIQSLCIYAYVYAYGYIYVYVYVYVYDGIDLIDFVLFVCVFYFQDASSAVCW